MFSVKNTGTKARISIIGNISDWENNSEEFLAQLNTIKQTGIIDVEIYINSFGGSVFQANEIVNIILGFEGTISFILGSVCASAATIIVAQVASARQGVLIEMYKNGQYMIHNVSATLDGEITAIESGLQLMRNLQENAKKAYATQTGLSIEEITAMMDKETWMNAQEALDKKFITGIVNNDMTQPANFSDIMNCGYKHVPKLIINENTKIENKMFEVINASLGTKFASETDVLNYIKNLQTENQKMKSDIENEQKVQQEAKIEAVLQEAIKAKKMLPGQKELYRKMLQDSYETAKQVIESLPIAESISGKITGKGKADEKETYRDLAEKNPEKLKDYFKNDFEHFNELFKAEYGTDYKK